MRDTPMHVRASAGVPIVPHSPEKERRHAELGLRELLEEDAVARPAEEVAKAHGQSLNLGLLDRGLGFQLIEKVDVPELGREGRLGPLDLPHHVLKERKERKRVGSAG